MADAESAKEVLVWHERWRETEIATKVVSVVRRRLLLVVIVLPPKAVVRCPRRTKLGEVGELFLGSRYEHRFGVFIYGPLVKRSKRVLNAMRLTRSSEYVQLFPTSIPKRYRYIRANTESLILRREALNLLTEGDTLVPRQHLQISHLVDASASRKWDGHHCRLDLRELVHKRDDLLLIEVEPYLAQVRAVNVLH